MVFPPLVGSHTPTLPKGHDCRRGSERSRSAGTSKVFPCVSSPSSPRRFCAKLHHKRLSMSCSIDPDPLKNRHHIVVEGFVCLLDLESCAAGGDRSCQTATNSRTPYESSKKESASPREGKLGPPSGARPAQRLAFGARV